METRSALVVGATGLVGGQLLQLLLRDELYSRVTILVRKSFPLTHDKLRVCVVDFDHLDRHLDVVTGDDVYCCLGTTIKAAGTQQAFRKVDFTYVVRIAALAAKNGSKQFLLVSSIGADGNSRVFYTRVKGEVEQAVGSLSFNAVQIFRPSFLLGERRERRSGEKWAMVFARLFLFVLIFGLRKYRAVHAKTLAMAMIRAAKECQPGVNVFESNAIQTMGKP